MMTDLDFKELQLQIGHELACLYLTFPDGWLEKGTKQDVIDHFKYVLAVWDDLVHGRYHAYPFNTQAVYGLIL